MTEVPDRITPTFDQLEGVHAKESCDQGDNSGKDQLKAWVSYCEVKADGKRAFWKDPELPRERSYVVATHVKQPK